MTFDTEPINFIVFLTTLLCPTSAPSLFLMETEYQGEEIKIASGQVCSASFPRLVDMLHLNNFGLNFTKEVLLVHTQFTTSDILLLILLSRYDLTLAQIILGGDDRADAYAFHYEYDENNNTNNNETARSKREDKNSIEKNRPDAPLKEVSAAIATQYRIFATLRMWMKYSPGAITKEMEEIIRTFFAYADKTSLFKGCLTYLDQYEKLQQDVLVLTRAPSNPGKVAEVSSWPVSDIAKQITLQDYKIFATTKHAEFTRMSWTNKSAPSLIHSIQRFNQLARWVSSRVLSFRELPDRIRMFENMISLAESLLQLQNYTSTAAVIAGLESAAVIRLRSTIAGLSKHWTSKFEELRSLFLRNAGFANYRRRLSEASPPIIPLLSKSLMDITFIFETSTDYNPSPLINWRKCKLLADVIHSQVLFQPGDEVGYDIAIIPGIIDSLNHFVFVSDGPTDHALYEISIGFEPRTSPLSP